VQRYDYKFSRGLNSFFMNTALVAIFGKIIYVAWPQCTSTIEGNP